MFPKSRQPLTPIENKSSNNNGNKMVKPSAAKQLSKSETVLIKPLSTLSPSKSSTPKSVVDSTKKIRALCTTPSSSSVSKKATSKSASDDGGGAALVTSKVPTIEYWKELAEARRVALEEALKENEMLTDKVEKLEKENKDLEEMVEQAKQLAEMINNLSEEHDRTADESGIGRDETREIEEEPTTY